MIELRTLAEISMVEVTLGILFTLTSLAITIYLLKMRKFGYFIYGFIFITLWNILETIDELVIKNAARELIFNIGGRIILIVGMILIILALKQFLRK